MGVNENPETVEGQQPPLKPGEYRMLPGDWTDPVMAAETGTPHDYETAVRRNRQRHRELEPSWR